MNTRVTIKAETPSEQIVKQAAQEHKITDSLNRQITLKKPGVLSEFRIIEVVGDSAKNQVYMFMVYPLTYVTEIDGMPVPFPSNKRELEALIQRLDSAGVDAVVAAVNEIYGEKASSEGVEDLKK